MLWRNQLMIYTDTALTHTGSAVVTRDYIVLLSWDVSSYLYPLSSPEQEFISGVSNAAPLPSTNAGVSNHPFPSLYHLRSKPSHVSASAYNMQQSLRFLTAYIIDMFTKTEHKVIYIGN